MQIIDKRDRARDTGIDRSTLSQLLADNGARLPNIHLVGTFAELLKVSSDWLLGMSGRPESAADLLSHALSLSDADQRLERFAQGYHDRQAHAFRT